MWSVVVVLAPPVFHEQLCFEQAVEAFDLEQLPSQVAVEGFDERVLPGCSGFDVAGLGVVEAAPVAERLRDELGAVVAADQRGSSAAPLDDLLECVDGVVGSHSSRDRSSQRFAGVLVGDREDLERAAIGGAVGDEVDRPHLIRPSCDEVTGHPRPTPTTLRFGRQPEPLIAPQPLQPLAVTGPALTAEDRVDPPVAVARMTASEPLQPLPEQRLLGDESTPVTLRRAMLTRQPTRPTLGNPE